ncbi:MAG: 3-deoxy-D-manno-octulosonic acid kinase [Cellvibrionaceae bacterium]
MAIKHKQIGKQHILYQDTLDTKDLECLFDFSVFIPEQLIDKQKVYQKAVGRGITYFFEQSQHRWVLRHYWRGGLIGKLLSDQYLWQSLEATRAYQELTLLDTLDNLKLPAPKPIAARIIKSGFYYQADIITQAIDNSQSLVQRLNTSLEATQWQKIGMTIGQFHQNNIYHDDLNAHNILITDASNIYLIDFDKGKQINDNSLWREKNLERLLRSLEKEKGLGKIKYFDKNNWLELLKGYKDSEKEYKEGK